MVILNRIINILILLAAIAAAVFSYLLFSKREKLIDGWSQMANAVNATAKVLDKDSGTNYSTTDLTAEKLGHANYDNLGSNLKKLNEAVTKVRDQRNDQIPEHGDCKQDHDDVQKLIALHGASSAVSTEAPEVFPYLWRFTKTLSIGIPTRFAEESMMRMLA